jgi:hypothetical protein
MLKLTLPTAVIDVINSFTISLLGIKHSFIFLKSLLLNWSGSTIIIQLSVSFMAKLFLMV